MDKKINVRRLVNIILTVFIALAVVACVIHVSVSYVSLLKANEEMTTSFPPYAAVIEAIPYSMAIFVAAIIMLVFNIVYRVNNKVSEK